jgi:hypothetical protein
MYQVYVAGPFIYHNGIDLVHIDEMHAGGQQHLLTLT